MVLTLIGLEAAPIDVNDALYPRGQINQPHPIVHALFKTLSWAVPISGV